MTAPGAVPRGRGGATLDLIAALRPQLWIAPIALFEAGRTAAGPPASPLTPLSFPALLGLTSLLALLGAIHLGNGWRDRRSDRLNRKGGAIAAGRLGKTSTTAAAMGCLLVAVVAAAFPAVSTTTRILLAVSGALGAAYVAPPFELKRRAWLDLAAQAAGYGVVAFAIGVSVTGRLAAGDFLASLPYAAGIATVGLAAMIADRAGDRDAGQRMTAVTLGPGASRGLVTGLAFLTAGAGLGRGDAVPSFWGLLAAAWLALWVRGAGIGDEPDRGDEPARWVRTAVALQLLFVLLLLPRTGWPLVSALGLGAATTMLSRRVSGTSYPWDVWRLSSTGVNRRGGDVDPR